MPSIKDYRDSIINQLTMAVDACISEQSKQMDSGNVDINLSTMSSEICFKFNNGSLDIKSKANLDFSKQLMGTIKTTSSK